MQNFISELQILGTSILEARDENSGTQTLKLLNSFIASDPNILKIITSKENQNLLLEMIEKLKGQKNKNVAMMQILPYLSKIKTD